MRIIIGLPKEKDTQLDFNDRYYTRAIKLSQTEGKGRFTRLIFLFASNRYKSLRIQSWRNNLRYNHNIITDETPYNIFRKYH